MFHVGDTVIVKPPFDEAFPGPRVITEITTGEDGSTTYILGDAGGFDALYLESV